MNHLDPMLIRGTFALRREGDAYSGTLTLHGFHYILTAEVAQDAGGRFFRGTAFDDMGRQIIGPPIPFLPDSEIDPRENASLQARLRATRDLFREDEIPDMAQAIAAQAR